MIDGKCAADGCHRQAVAMSNRCVKHKLWMQRYGSDLGPGIKVRFLQKHFDAAARERLEQLAAGGEKSQAALAWAEETLRKLLRNETYRMNPIVRWQRLANAWMQRVPDDAGMRRRLLARVLATEMAMDGARPPDWRGHDAEAINRGRLLVAGHGYVAPKQKYVLRELGQALMDSQLIMWCHKLLEHDKQRRADAQAAAAAAIGALSDE
jgi:hypothetical protein